MEDWMIVILMIASVIVIAIGIFAMTNSSEDRIFSKDTNHMEIKNYRKKTPK